MELNTIVTKLDNSELPREVIDLKNFDGNGISYRNQQSTPIVLTVNNENYEELIKICLIPNGKSVKLYINNITDLKLTSMDIEDVSTFSIS